MKRHMKKVLSIILVVLVVAITAVPAAATYDNTNQTRASAYITSCYADVTLINNRIDVYFRITGTGTMTSLGATEILIYNQSGYCVAILDSSNTSGLMGSNTVFYSNTVSWNGASSGTRYFAVVGFKAANSTGYDTTCYTTLYT